MISDEDPALGAFSVQILSKVGAHLPEAVCKAPAKLQAAVPHLIEVAESGPPKASKAAVRYEPGDRVIQSPSCSPFWSLYMLAG